jgi:hypothetical protein
MGDETPITKSAVEYAEKFCPTESHKYGYMISHAQGLEIALADYQRAAAASIPKEKP